MSDVYACMYQEHLKKPQQILCVSAHTWRIKLILRSHNVTIYDTSMCNKMTRDYPRLFRVHFRYILISYRFMFLHTYHMIQIWPKYGTRTLCTQSRSCWEADWTLTYPEWLSEVLVFGHLMARASAEVLFVVGCRLWFGFRTVRLDRSRLQGCCGRSGRASRRVRGSHCYSAAGYGTASSR